MAELSQNETSYSPDFANPPVVETALSVQFSGLEKWQAVHHGLYYETIRGQYPRFRQEAALPPIVETFPFVPKVPQIQFGSRPDPGRGLFTADDESCLIQVQANRFGFNWRRLEADAAYPRFVKNSEVFRNEFDAFNSFCEREGLGRAEPTFCEVVYVNHILAEAGEDIPQLIEAVFTSIHIASEENLLPPPEFVLFNRTYVLGDQAGRLYAEASVAMEPPSAQQYVVFKLTSRMRHLQGDVLSTLQSAHDWLNKGFVSLTRKECREQRWEQSNGA